MRWETVAERIIAHVAEAKMHLLLAAHMRPGDALVQEIALMQRSIDGAKPYIDELGGMEKLPKPVLLEWLIVTKGIVALRERQKSNR